MTLLIASVRPAHHPHKSGLSAECIWKRQVVWGWGVGVRKVGRVQLGSAAAAAWARAQRTGAVCGCGQCRPTYKVQLALGGGGEGVLWSAEGGCTLHNAFARLLWSRCTARLQEEGREALCSTDPILCTCWTFPQQSSVQLPWKFPKTTYIFPPLQGFIKPLSALQHQEKKIHPFGRWQGPQCFDL